MDKTALYSFMADNRYGVVSSVGEDDTPQSALVGIAVTLDLEVVFDTLSTSRKYSNLLQRPACSLVVGWSGEQTVQLEGNAFEPEDDKLKFYQAVYFTTFPDGSARLSWPKIRYLVVTPRWIRFSNYDRNPPLVDET